MADVFSGLIKLIGPLGSWAASLPATLDERFGTLAPIAAGAAAAVVVATVMTIYFRGERRSSFGDILRHGFAAIVVLGLLAFAASHMRHEALADASQIQVELRLM
jgi:hypothetical protein